MTERRVVVTGQGVVSSLGLNAEAHVKALRDGACGIGPIELISTENLTIGIAAEAKAFKGEDHFSRSEIWRPWPQRRRLPSQAQLLMAHWVSERRPFLAHRWVVSILKTITTV